MENNIKYASVFVTSMQMWTCLTISRRDYSLQTISTRTLSDLVLFTFLYSFSYISTYIRVEKLIFGPRTFLWNIKEFYSRLILWDIKTAIEISIVTTGKKTQCFKRNCEHFKCKININEVDKKTKNLKVEFQRDR